MRHSSVNVWFCINVLLVVVYILCGFVLFCFTLVICENVFSRWRLVRTIELAIVNCEECSKRNENENISSHITEMEYENIQDRECVICFTNMEIEDIERLRCQHFFHRECLSTWMEIKKSCPICRSKECCVRIID